MKGGGRRKENASSADGGLRLSQNLDSYRPMCDTSLSNQRRYAPRVAEMTGLSGRFDRNTQTLKPVAFVLSGDVKQFRILRFEKKA